MDILIINKVTGFATLYTPAELRRIARLETKGKGKLTGFFVECPTNGNPRLVSEYQQPDNWRGQVHTAI